MASVTGRSYFAALFFTLLALGGCGEGYEIKPARLNVIETTDDSRAQLSAMVAGFLGKEGFENLGRYDAMISLIRQGPMPEATKEEELARLNRERTFLNEPRNLRIVLSDYSNVGRSKLSLPYAPPSQSFTEINIYEERPGGFSPYGQQFYGRFLSALQNKYGTSVIVVNDPPPTDEAEYRRITLVNDIGAVVGWLIALIVPFIFTGFLTYRFLRITNLPILGKRSIFILVNLWLITPLPFQGGFIFVFPMPNLFAFPWTDSGFYSRIASYAAISFPGSALLCAIVSLFLFKNDANTKAANESWEN